MKVRNMTSPRGNKVPNQFVIEDGGVVYLQSYSSIIAKIDYNENKTFLDEYYWDYSRTTSTYRNMFLGATTDEVKKRIKSGEYQLVNLN